MRQRHTHGSVRFDKRRKTWNYLYYVAGKRRSKLIGTKQNYPTKAAAWTAVASPTDSERQGKRRHGHRRDSPVRSGADAIAPFHGESLPLILREPIQPKWGDTLIRDMLPRPVELWLRNLPLSPKSKTHVRSLLYGLVEYAMWSGSLEISRNPISLVQNNGATRKTRKARSLTAEQFHALLRELHEPFATMALLCVCLGLRISEALALQWGDVDWLGSKVSIKRGIVEQVVDATKTESSAKTVTLAADLLSRLKSWRRGWPN